MRLQETKDTLRRKQEEQRQLQKFNDFLESIVQDMGNQNGGGAGANAGDNEAFQNIEELQNRFKNLKSENEKLMRRKQAINREMELARQQEAVRLGELQNVLYE